MCIRDRIGTVLNHACRYNPSNLTYTCSTFSYNYYYNNNFYNYSSPNAPVNTITFPSKTGTNSWTYKYVKAGGTTITGSLSIPLTATSFTNATITGAEVNASNQPIGNFNLVATATETAAKTSTTPVLGSITLSTATLQLYAPNFTDYETITLSGLTISDTATTAQISVPLTYSNTYGESLTGNLTINEASATLGGGYIPTSFALNVQFNSGSTQLVSATLNFNITDYSNYNINLPLSNTNYLTANATANLTLSNNVNLVVKAQATTNASESIDVKFTTDKSYIDCSGQSTNLDPQNHFIYSTINCASSGNYSAVITNTTPTIAGNTVGQLNGAIYNGTTQVGTVESNGQINIDGTYYSLE